ncbi:MAG: TlpA family protein disulfide reductase [Aridibacter sp.]
MTLHKIIFLIVGFILIFNTNCSVKPDSTFSISGQIKNAPNNFMILTQEEDINRKISKAITKIPLDENGKFDMNFDLEPHIYTLNLDENKKLTLAIDKGQKIIVEGDAKDLPNVKISGSDDTEKLQAYEKFRKQSLERLVFPVREEIKKIQENDSPLNDMKIEELGKAEIDNYDKHKDELIEFVKEKMGTTIAVYATSLRWDGEKNIPVLESLANDFEKKHPDLEITKKIKEKVKILKNTSIGGTVPNINLPDKIGQETALFPLKGKYTLIDFWASWCSPCRRESKTLAGLYEKYHDKGFEIYGVSLDDEKDLWLNAIEKDKRTWTNVSSLQGFETPITFDYAVTALPAKFIVDENGKIVAKNLHGKELQEKVESLFTE